MKNKDHRTSHYFTNEIQAEHERKSWTFTLYDQLFTFTTDSHVFSRERVDFGSCVLLEAFDDCQLPAGTILDMGCGYGPIGLALAHKTDRLIEMVDINQRAVDLAQENAQQNGIDNVLIHPSDVYTNLQKAPYAAIVSNPPVRAGKAVVHQILSQAYDYLLPGGSLTIVLQKKQGAPSAQKKMMEVFGNAQIIRKEKGYYIISSTKVR